MEGDGRNVGMIGRLCLGSGTGEPAIRLLLCALRRVHCEEGGSVVVLIQHMPNGLLSKLACSAVATTLEGCPRASNRVVDGVIRVSAQDGFKLGARAREDEDVRAREITVEGLVRGKASNECLVERGMVCIPVEPVLGKMVEGHGLGGVGCKEAVHW